jgi:hypothetical protein
MIVPRFGVPDMEAEAMLFPVFGERADVSLSDDGPESSDMLSELVFDFDALVFHVNLLDVMPPREITTSLRGDTGVVAAVAECRLPVEYDFCFPKARLLSTFELSEANVTLLSPSSFSSFLTSDDACFNLL